MGKNYPIFEVGVAGACPPTSKLETFWQWSLAISMLIYSNFQISGALGETPNFQTSSFPSKIGGLEVSEFLPKLYFIRNFYNLAYLEPRTITKTSLI